MTTDPIICRHVGRSTWQGPASAAPRKEDRMAGLTAEVSVGDGAVMDIINPQSFRAVADALLATGWTRKREEG